jgi:hypothetical protein
MVGATDIHCNAPHHLAGEPQDLHKTQSYQQWCAKAVGAGPARLCLDWHVQSVLLRVPWCSASVIESRILIVHLSHLLKRVVVVQGTSVCAVVTSCHPMKDVWYHSGGCGRGAVEP